MVETAKRRQGGDAKAAGKGGSRAKGTGAQLVYEKLRSDILDLSIEPGALLYETELSKRYNVSRSPVREALIRLAAEGMVKTLRNRSAVVASFDLAELLGYFDALDLIYRSGARLAALNAGADAIEEIRAALLAHEDAIRKGDWKEVMSRNSDFHMAIARAGANPYIASWTEDVLLSGQRIIRLYMRHFKDEPSDEMRGEHRELLGAIERGDADAAEASAADDARILSSEMLAFLTQRRAHDVRPASTQVHRSR